MIQDDILIVLREGPSTTPEIATEIHASASYVRGYINRLKKRGLVREFGVMENHTPIWELVES